LTAADSVTVFDSVRYIEAGDVTVVVSLAQLALVQLALGVGGELPPVESTDA
jgi:hypothetical protein